MFRKVLGLFVLSLSALPVACLDEATPQDFTTKDTCYAGDERSCTCKAAADGGTAQQGIQLCDEKTGKFAVLCECGNAPASSSQSGGNQQGSGGGAGGGGGAAACVDAATDCPANASGFATPCCINGKCGVDPGGNGCMETNQPGTLDPACPDVAVQGITLPGCCRPDGKCGGMETQFLNLGCVDVAAQTGGPSQSCAPVPQ